MSLTLFVTLFLVLHLLIITVAIKTNFTTSYYNREIVSEPNYKISGLYACGAGGLGQLGISTWWSNVGKSDFPRLVLNSSTLRVRYVASGDMHTIFTTEDNRIFSFGSSFATGIFTPIAPPPPIAYPREVTLFASKPNARVYAASHYSIVTYGSEIWGMGMVSNGELGEGFGRWPDVWPRILSYTGRTFTSIATGEKHVLGLTPDADVYSWGANDGGQLMRSGNTSYPNPVPMSILYPPRKKFVKIFAFGSSSFVVTQYGELFGAGWNTFGIFPEIRLGQAVMMPMKIRVGNLSDVVQIAVAKTHVLFLKSNGTVYCLGKNTYGELGVDASYGLTVVPHFTRCDRIGAAYGRSWCFTPEGVLGAGQNGAGELGIGYISPSEASAQQLNLSQVWTNITGLSPGQSRTIFIAGECLDGTSVWRDGICGPLFSPFEMKTSNCSTDTCFHGACDDWTDMCVCDSGWSGVHCDLADSGVTVGIVAGVVVGTVLVFVIILIVASMALFCFCRHHHHHLNANSDTKTPHIYHKISHLHENHEISTSEAHTNVAPQGDAKQ